MADALRTALSVFTGRYWWVLIVRNCRDGRTAHILRVLRGRGNGHSYVDLSFSGALEDCRRFQERNGGSADGILLVDDVTPVKVVQIEDEKFKKENFEYVNSIDGDFVVVALRRAVEDVAEDVKKARFKILAHFSQIFFEIDMFRQNDLSGSWLITNDVDGISRNWFFIDGKPFAVYKFAEPLVNKDTGRSRLVDLIEFIRERFFLDSVNVEETFLEIDGLAKAVVEDVWLFRVNHLPVFSTLPDSAAVERIRKAVLFRRIFKACVGVFLATLFVTCVFWGGVSWYVAESETQIASFEKNVESRRELEKVWKKIEADKAKTEKFLSHRSRISSSLSVIVTDLPANSWITHWGIHGNSLSLQGYSASSEEVSRFLSTLESEKKLVNVRLRTTEKALFKRKPVVKFDLSAEIVP